MKATTVAAAASAISKVDWLLNHAMVRSGERKKERQKEKQIQTVLNTILSSKDFLNIDWVVRMVQAATRNWRHVILGCVNLATLKATEASVNFLSCLQDGFSSI